MTDVYKAPEATLQEPIEGGQYGSMENALAGNFQVQPIETMKKAWEMLKGMKTKFWLAVLIYGVVNIVFGAIEAAVFGLESDYGVGKFIWGLAVLFVVGPMAAGLTMIALKHSVGAPYEVGEIFKHFDKIVPIFLTYILMYIGIALGLILLIIPGVYLMVAFSFALILVVEKDMSAIEALKTSRKVVHFQWFNVLGLVLLCSIVAFLGFVALLVGALWTVPLAALTFAMVYRDVFGVEEKTLAGS